MRRWIVLTAVTFSMVGSSVAGASDLWTEIHPAAISARGEREIIPEAYLTLELDLPALAAVLSDAPMAGSARAEIQGMILEMPLPNGSFGRFRIEEAPIMAPELAARFPEIKTYRGRGVDDPTATLRFDLTPKGFHAMGLTASGSFWIDPYQRQDTEHYVVYRKRDYHRVDPAGFTCGVTEPAPGASLSAPPRAAALPLLRGSLPSNGGILRDYRIAVAATGEYTAFHSDGPPTVAEGLAAIVTAMNRINGIFERVLSITMTLVADNDQIVYTDGGSDPYTNGDVVSTMFENETNLNAVIGLANYDVGHVFSTGGGGVAILEVPCTAIKARGASAGSSPINDPFWVYVVSHELGHQWGASHTFNSDSGACSGSQYAPESAYEPGSGSTIQSYAGGCSPHNLQGTPDDYYHTISVQDITAYSVTGNGSSCAMESITGNGIPTVDAGPDYTIPVDTPFELCGTASDPDTHPLTFNWEQLNLGPAGDPSSPVADAPIFRSWPDTLSPCRTFPRLADLLAGTSTVGELLPSYARTLTMRLTARDNQATGGAYATDSTDLEVTDQAGPFVVTAPNSGTWTNATESVTWNVAGTDLAPVSCSAVDISLSTDGGLTFPHILADETANDGEHSIAVIPEATTEARVKVACSDNVFFDLSDQNFTIELAGFIFADGFESGDASAWTTTVP